MALVIDGKIKRKGLLVSLLHTTFFRMRTISKKYRGTRHSIKDMFSSLQSSMGGNNRGLKYYCMNCGKEHNDIACPNCGSKMKRVG